MTVVNQANRLYLGGQMVGAVYAGSVKVWPVASTFKPPDIPGLSLWLDASTLALGDLPQWPDKSQKAAHGLVVGDPPPQVIDSSGKRVVSFTTNLGRIRGSGTGVDKSYTAFVVARMLAVPTGYGRILNSQYPPTNLLFGWWNDSEDIAYAGDFFVPDVSKPNSHTWKLYSLDAEASPAYKPRLFSNGAFITGDTAAGSGYPMVDGWANNYGLSGYDPSANNETCNCEVAEVVMYNFKMTDNERQQVEGYLRNKWKL